MDPSRRQVLAGLGASGVAAGGLLHMTYSATDPDDDGTVEADTDNQSTQTKTLNNVKDASQFSGADGGTQIQNAIDEANGEAGSNIVVVDGAGPDDVSGSTGSVSDALRAQNAWKLTSHLSIPSFTTLIVHNAYIFLADGADDNFVRNDDFTNGNEHIAIVGDGNTVWDGNDDNQTQFDNSTADARKNLGFRFFTVDDLTLHQFRVRETNAWAVKAEDVTDCRITELTIKQSSGGRNRDGPHVVGPAEEVTISDIEGRAEDDTVAVGANEPSGFGYNDGGGGDVSDVTIANVASEQHDAHTVRVFEGDDRSGTLHTIRNITISNITHENLNASGGAVILGDGNDVDDSTKFTDVTVSNVTAQSAPALVVASACRNVDVSGLTARNANDVVKFTHGKNTNLSNFKSNCGGVTISGIHGTEVTHLWRQSGEGGIEDSTFENFTLKSDGDTALTAFVRVAGSNGNVVGTLFSNFTGFSNDGNGNPSGSLLETTGGGARLNKTQVTDANVRQVDTLFDLEDSDEVSISNIEVNTFNTAYTNTTPLEFGTNVPTSASDTTTPVGVEAFLSSDQTVTSSGSLDPIPFDRTGFEDAQIASLDTTNNVIDIHSDGTYHIEFQLTYSDLPDGGLYKGVVKRNGNAITEFFAAAQSSFTDGKIFSKTKSLVDGDTIKFVTNNSSSSDADVSGLDRRTYVSVTKIR